MMQQSWPCAQQWSPQQKAPIALHSMPGLSMHAGSGPQVPLSQ
jgi:hypothetical protein